MNQGDRVTGVPLNRYLRSVYPTITGTLHLVGFEIDGHRFQDALIHVDTTAVDIEDGTLRLALPSERDTVFGTDE